MFQPSDWVPNNQRLPVLLYRQAVGAASASALRARFAECGWTGIWTDGVFPYQHYHSGAHEVLGVGQGTARVLIGGPDGEVIELSPGDCLLLPAGTGHRNLGSSPDFEVVGAYPKGQAADIQTLAPSPDMLARIAALPVPDTDPVLGPAGGLVEHWPRLSA